MKTKAKSWILAAGIFTIGLIIGALGSQLFFRYQVNQIVSHRSPPRVFRFIERVVEPTPDQRPELEGILVRHGGLLMEQMRQHRRQQLDLLAALKEDLGRILRPDQMKRLDEHLARRSFQSRPERRKRRGPGCP